MITVIVPYRDRAPHLALFLQHYRRKLPDAFFVIVEQENGKPFNRGKLLNIGAIESPQADYYVFHDVDMLIQGTPDYSYPQTPVHAATNCSQFNWELPFPEYFGGVVLFSRAAFALVGGYSNNFWGWGGEDNEMYLRTTGLCIPIERRVHRYFSLPHPRSHPTGLDPEKMEQAKQPRNPEDCLQNCNFKVISRDAITRGVIIKVEI